MPRRTDIRKMLKTICESIDGFTADTVMLGRQRSIPSQKLPAICIYMENEQKQLAYAGSPRAFDRGNDYIFEIHVQASTTEAVEDLLDTYCDQLEAALVADETLGGLVRDVVPVIDEYTIDEDSARPAGVADCRYTITHAA